ncbi:hypothetical protein IE53DRAFT_383676, partial [Violaceomyces palustris]
MGSNQERSSFSSSAIPRFVGEHGCLNWFPTPHLLQVTQAFLLQGWGGGKARQGFCLLDVCHTIHHRLSVAPSTHFPVPAKRPIGAAQEFNHSVCDDGRMRRRGERVGGHGPTSPPPMGIGWFSSWGLSFAYNQSPHAVPPSLPPTTMRSISDQHRLRIASGIRGITGFPRDKRMLSDGSVC